MPFLLKTAVWAQAAHCSYPYLPTEIKLLEFKLNLIVTKLYLYFVDCNGSKGRFTAMVDARANNSFVHSSVIQYLNAETVDVPAMRVTLADSSYADCFAAILFYLRLGGNIQ